MRASIRIVAGQASREAVGCKLLWADHVCRSPIIGRRSFVFDFTRFGKYPAGDPILPVLRRFLAIRGADPMTWLLRRSVKKKRIIINKN